MLVAVAFCSGCRFLEFVLWCACMSGVFLSSRRSLSDGGVFGIVGHWFLPLFLSCIFLAVLK